MNVETTAEWRKPGSEARDPDARRTDLAFLDFIWTRRTLTKAGRPIKLTPKETLVLGLLLSRAGQVVAISDLITGGWGDEPVGPESLNRCLSGLRRKVPTICEHLRTHHRLGYCLAVDVRKIHPTQPEGAGLQVENVLRTAERLTGLFSAECCTAALRVLRNSLELGLEDPRIHAAIASVEFARLDLGHVAPRSGAAAAISAARRATANGESDAKSLSLLGMLRVVYNNDLEGLRLTDVAAEITPNDLEVQYRRLYAYRVAGIAPIYSAEVFTSENYRLGDEFGGHAIHGLGLLHQGRIEDARDVAVQGIAQFPYDHRLLILAAMIESALCDHEAAIEYGRILCQTRSQGSGHSEFLLALHLQRGGYVEEAVALLEKTLNDPGQFRPSAFAAAALHQIKGPDAGADMLQRARAAGCLHVEWLPAAAGMIVPEELRLVG